MTSTPRIAVVIVNLDGGEVLERCLDALAAQTVPARRVVVVDNGSIDGSADRAADRHPDDVEVVRLERNLGFAAANNLGVRLADDCEWIALLNPDAFPEPDWLEALLRATESHPEYSFFGSRLVRAAAPDELDGTGDVYHVGGMAWRRDNGRVAAGRRETADEIFSPCAAAALYGRALFLEAGGFDEDFFCYYEDTDLAFRLRLTGHRCLYVPDAVAHHVGFAITGEESEFTVYHSQRNIVWAYAKNMPRPLIWLYLPQHVLVNLFNIAWYALRGRGRAVLRSKRDALAGLPRAVRKRRAIQKARTVGARDLRRLMEGGAGPYVTGFKRAWRTWRGEPAALEDDAAPHTSSGHRSRS